jgi:hypothetical protein
VLSVQPGGSVFRDFFQGVRAVLLDVDGTLADSNGFHVRAWDEAFHRCNRLISVHAIHQQIGKGADQLIPALAPDSGPEERAAISHAHDEIFRTRYLSITAPWLAYQSQLSAGRARLLDYIGTNCHAIDAARGTEHDSDPGQVVGHSGGARTLDSSILEVLYELAWSNRESIRLTNSMSLEELQMYLFASLPARDGLECLDVPTDQACERARLVVLPERAGWLLERYFSGLRPAIGGRTQ